MKTTRRKPKWWHIDWVELGCRGWDITVEGACFGEQRRGCGEYANCFAHLDRDTLGLHLHGPCDFLAKAMSDLMAAQVFRFVERDDTTFWSVIDCLEYTGSTGYPPRITLGGNTTAGSGTIHPKFLKAS